MTYKHEGPFESFLDGKIPNIPESGMITRNRTECLLNDAMDYIAGTLEQPNNPHAWDHLLIYCPREIIERRVAAFAPAVQERSISPYPDLELWNTRRILELLISRFNFDGMDPNSFTISELRRAATGETEEYGKNDEIRRDGDTAFTPADPTEDVGCRSIGDQQS